MQMSRGAILSWACGRAGRPRQGRRGQIWGALTAKAPADAPWLPTVREALKRVGGSGSRRRRRGPALAERDYRAAAKEMAPAIATR